MSCLHDVVVQQINIYVKHLKFTELRD